jgi:hypothetical protein
MRDVFKLMQNPADDKLEKKLLNKYVRYKGVTQQC